MPDDQDLSAESFEYQLHEAMKDPTEDMFGLLPYQIAFRRAEVARQKRITEQDFITYPRYEELPLFNLL